MNSLKLSQFCGLYECRGGNNSQSATILWFMLQAVDKRKGNFFLKMNTSAGRTILKKH